MTRVPTISATLSGPFLWESVCVIYINMVSSSVRISQKIMSQNEFDNIMVLQMTCPPIATSINAITQKELRQSWPGIGMPC